VVDYSKEKLVEVNISIVSKIAYNSMATTSTYKTTEENKPSREYRSQKSLVVICNIDFFKCISGILLVFPNNFQIVFNALA
jgi:hypothetical protein